MSFAPIIPNPHLGAFGTGLLYGLLVCTSACLPHVASYVAGVGASFRRGIMITLAYNFGRIVAYAAIGSLIGAVNGLFRIAVNEEMLRSVQAYSAIAFGAVTMIIGADIIRRSRFACDKCEEKLTEGKNKTTPRFDIRAFSLGISRGLVVCPPLITLLLYTSAFAAPIDSLVVAVLFGLGTALSPIIVLGGATGWILSKAFLFQKWISLSGGAILIVLGAGTILTTLASRYA